jgi:predicted transcriptional regulator
MTAAEFAVMKALWQVGRGTVADIRERHAELSGSEQAYTTIMTLLSRLACKGAVNVDKSKQPFTYRPAVRRESVLRERLRKFLDTVFDGRADALVLHLMEDESLGADELERIRSKLGELDDDSEGEA